VEAKVPKKTLLVCNICGFTHDITDKSPGDRCGRLEADTFEPLQCRGTLEEVQVRDDPNPERREGHSALLVEGGELTTFDPHPPKGFREFQEEYGGVDGLYLAMLDGTVAADERERAWLTCAGNTFASWVAARGLEQTARDAMVRDGLSEAARGHINLLICTATSGRETKADEGSTAKPVVQRLHSPGVQRISDERMRQILQEGFTAEHDDQHTGHEMVKAAVAYASIIEIVESGQHKVASTVPPLWPWDKEWWKPSTDPIRNLEKSAALLAAEIDRLLRLREKEK
jgi:hypothetical protein